MRAIVRHPGLASVRAASADIAAVRIAVVIVSSESMMGAPVATSARMPNAITVGRPRAVFFGCPLTYLNANWVASAIGINSTTPSGEWQATRALLSNSDQREKSCLMRSATPAIHCGSPMRWTRRTTSLGLRWIRGSVFDIGVSCSLNRRQFPRATRQSIGFSPVNFGSVLNKVTHPTVHCVQSRAEGLFVLARDCRSLPLVSPRCRLLPDRVDVTVMSSGEHFLPLTSGRSFGR